MLQVIYNEGILAQDVMDLDKKMLDELSVESLPILHLYEWKNPSITYGHFINPEKYLKMENLKKFDMDIARRPTGGGVVFHLWDMAFSFLMPSNHKKFSLNTLDNYFFVNRAVLSAVKKKLGSDDCFSNFSDLALFDNCQTKNTESDIHQNFCMARPTKYDVIIKGKKLAGAAQRRTKKGYLHQGTISLVLPDLDILDQLLLDKNTIFFMNLNTFSLFKQGFKLSADEKKDLKGILIKEFEKNLF